MTKLGLASVKANLKGFNQRDKKMIPLEQISVGEYQPREGIDWAWVDDLSESIEAFGLLEPIHVVFEDDVYKAINGHHRFEAVKKLGRSEIEVIVTPSDVPPERRRINALIQNIQKPLTPWEMARSLKELQDEGYSLDQLGKVVGKSKSTAKDYLRVLELPSEYLKAYLDAEGKLAPALVIEVARESDLEKRAALWESVASGEIETRDDVREVRRTAKKAKDVKKASKTTVKQRFLRDLVSAGERAQRIIDEGIELNAEEYREVSESLKGVLDFLTKQAQKLDESEK